MEKSRYVIGIDGGGSRTIALLADESGDILAEEAGGPSNIQAVGIEIASKNILKLIKVCCAGAQCPSTMIDAVLLGLAGAGRASDQAKMTAALQKLALSRRMPLTNVVVESDARIALEGAFRGAPGIIVIGGTGSIAYGKEANGTIHRVGGWGRIVGDEGGGYAIGREGLTAVLRQYDGRGEPTVLSEMIADTYGMNDTEKIVHDVYTDAFDIASLAPLVIQAAHDGDRVAEKILSHGAVEIEEHLRVLSAKLNSTQKIHVALLGGVLSGENYYAKMVRDKITGSLPTIQIQPAMASAAFGAVLMALSIVRKS